ncbi:preprotein translocase subunit SecE [Patescibacteria group bacterium]|nr:preprotein translocase subunit SecE [Patescibacteria group bacterium]
MSKITDNQVVKYFRESKEEFKKVTWPSQRETIRYSIVIVVISVSLAAYFGLADWLISLGLDALLNITK